MTNKGMAEQVEIGQGCAIYCFIFLFLLFNIFSLQIKMQVWVFFLQSKGTKKKCVKHRISVVQTIKTKKTRSLQIA